MDHSINNPPNNPFPPAKYSSNNSPEQGPDFLSGGAGGTKKPFNLEGEGLLYVN